MVREIFLCPEVYMPQELVCSGCNKKTTDGSRYRIPNSGVQGVHLFYCRECHEKGVPQKQMTVQTPHHLIHIKKPKKG